MTITEKIEKLEKLRDQLPYKEGINKDEYKNLKSFYDINIDYWKEQLELSLLEGALID